MNAGNQQIFTVYIFNCYPGVNVSWWHNISGTTWDVQIFNDLGGDLYQEMFLRYWLYENGKNTRYAYLALCVTLIIPVDLVKNSEGRKTLLKSRNQNQKKSWWKESVFLISCNMEEWTKESNACTTDGYTIYMLIIPILKTVVYTLY